LASEHELTELANARMPFGRFKDRYLIDLPDAYLVWFSRQGFPEGKLGRMLEAVLEIKTNGLEKLLRPLRREGEGHG
jgi:uncharacterized protein